MTSNAKLWIRGSHWCKASVLTTAPSKIPIQQTWMQNAFTWKSLWCSLWRQAARLKNYTSFIDYLTISQTRLALVDPDDFPGVNGGRLSRKEGLRYLSVYSFGYHVFHLSIFLFLTQFWTKKKRVKKTPDHRLDQVHVMDYQGVHHYFLCKTANQSYGSKLCIAHLEIYITCLRGLTRFRGLVFYGS